jgi:transcription antitermination protein NusB
MKTAKDPRHRRRIKLMQELFETDFNSSIKPSKEVQPILGDLKKIDATITKSAPLWPIKQINRIDLAILRLAVYELLLKKTPQKVVIDEAVELAKEFGSDASPSFINGVLGKVLE